jgi:hypothetical protein
MSILPVKRRVLFSQLDCLVDHRRRHVGEQVGDAKDGAVAL